MRLFAGVDGGQSSTVAAIGDERGRVLARASGGPTDHVDEPIGSLRRAETLARLLDAALARAGLPADSRFAAVVAGISGYEGRDDAAPAQLATDAFRLLHDAPIALHGALAGAPGVVVIAGTGSVAYGVDQRGRSALAGGWGYLFGDEGSAFWIARRALSSAMRAEDARRPTALGEAALAFFDLATLRLLVREFATRRLSRARIAAFARVVADAARLGDAEAGAILDEGAAALAGAAVTVATALEFWPRGEATVSYAGGALRSLSPLRERWVRELERIAPSLRIREPRYEPVLGALLLAYRDAGVAVDALDPGAPHVGGAAG